MGKGKSHVQSSKKKRTSNRERSVTCERVPGNGAESRENPGPKPFALPSLLWYLTEFHRNATKISDYEGYLRGNSRIFNGKDGP
ncbi:hypothetical protein GWI33_011433 [Rhynchophorus ferrugineus]|uniref:Uncharacterized protein n=1 Tax=Rhynchophorus ferrugineus TaxID=354439 RepID=A0A834IRS9_RHYFE|nr:hypothetical protein GWI33_011433 [Rhynchophorus ferrugineus]